MIVNMNSLKDENEIMVSETKRKRNKKVTPDEMLEKMNKGIEEEAEERQQTQHEVVEQEKLYERDQKEGAEEDPEL